MATIGSNFDPTMDFLVNPQVVGIIIRLSIPDNDTHWQVFENDEQIALFIQNSGEFAHQLQPMVKEAYGDQIMQLKSNKLPNGLITLENLFDKDDAKRDKRKLTADKGDYTEMSGLKPSIPKRPLPSAINGIVVKHSGRIEDVLNAGWFLRLHQVLVKGEDQHKIAFTTKWGTFAYQKMSFELSNASATFQRAMDLAFK
ncbi:uncharacterized protein LOC131857409 [Cryptomeria japonica]|uniref:uncharacterized protein LOC131857409 n=1 Tax=Cryptomeria japonica TaxID=3369 RepID=UPI0027D9CEC8|nr:uncharacterized protein LOC131857409 [Cryptomeria japonica]